MVTLLDAALTYAANGLPVFPCVPDEKRPLTTHGFHDATVDQAQIEAWWEQWPTANIAMPTGQPTRATVIDLDGPEGIAYVKEHRFPATWTVRTPRGGYHLYYVYNPALHTGAAFVPEVDVRNDGGYVLLPPSIVNGKPYTIIKQTPPVILTVIPAELRQHGRNGTAARATTQSDRATPQPPSWVSDALRGVSESLRNDTATRLAGYFHAKGLASDIIMALMEAWADRCAPPMERRELEQTIHSVTRYPTTVQGVRGLGDETIFLR